MALNVCFNTLRFGFMKYALFFPLAVLMACAPVTETAAPEETVPEATAPPPPPNARTVEQFDTTTEAERVAAAAPSAGGQRLGETVATLGDVAAPGFWVETPMVDSVTNGRVVNKANDKSVEVELRPVTGSSRISLAAMRLLDASLTELVTLEVFQG